MIHFLSQCQTQTFSGFFTTLIISFIYNNGFCSCINGGGGLCFMAQGLTHYNKSWEKQQRAALVIYGMFVYCVDKCRRYSAYDIQSDLS